MLYYCYTAISIDVILLLYCYINRCYITVILQVHYQPTPLINLQSEQSELVVLSSFTCHEENVFVLVETTAPPTQKKLKKRRSNQRSLGR